MSAEEKAAGTDGATDFLSKVNPVTLISVAVGAVLVALFAMISLVLLLTLSSDISRLEDQMRKITKSTKTMEQDLADLKTAAASASGAAKPKTVSAGPSHMDAADPEKDCVVRAGSGKDSLANCLK